MSRRRQQLELADKFAEARALWLEAELLADDLFDEELDSRVAVARLAILDCRDRLAQLRADSLLDDLEASLELDTDADEAAA